MVDGSGNTATATQTVTVTDNVNPTITAPAAVAATTNTGCTATGVLLGSPVTADNCTTVTVTNNAPTAFPLGATTVTWTVVDGSGNTATATQTVTVTDNVNPTITAPAAVAATTNTGCTATGVLLGTPVTNDNCSVASVTNNAPSSYPVGTTTVIWTVVDGSGNTATATQTVTVTDNVNPTITAPAAVAVNADQGLCTASGVSLGTPSTADNCAVASVTNNAPATFPVGTTTVTWTVVDVNGNTNTATQSVTVTDTQAPVISGTPASFTATITCAGPVSWTAPTATDNCNVTSFTSNIQPGASFPIGNTTVTYTAIDAAGNTTITSFVVTVNGFGISNTTSSDVTCNGAANGTAAITVINAQGTVSYLWSNGATTAAVSNLTPGSYTVTATNGACVVNSSVTIAEPAALVVSTASTNVTCNGAANGTATASFTGGNSGHTYSWSNGATTAAINNLTPGTYTVIVTDSKGCSDTKSVTITEPAVLAATSTQGATITCWGATTTVTVAATGGTAPYTGTGTFTVGGGTYNYTITDANGCTTATSITVSQPPALPALGAIQGTLTNCVSYAAGSVTYTIAPVTDGVNTTTYTWTVPTGLTITSGQGTNTITASWTSLTIDPSISGTVSVVAVTACTSRTQTAAVSYASTSPVTPGSISGDSRLCPGVNATYSVAPVARATSYNWTVPTGMTITSGQGTNVITVTVGGSYSGGNVTVSAANACGASPVRTRSTVINTPQTPGTISGQANGVCGASSTYTIANVSGATSYTWAVPATASIASGQGTNSITVTWPSSGAGGSVSVQTVNGCGSSSARTLTVNTAPARPDTSGAQPTSACGGQAYTYGVKTAPGATSYAWLVTPGGSITSGQGTKFATVTWGTGVPVSQTITVRAANGCGTSLNRTIAVSVNNCVRENESIGTILSMTAYPNPTSDNVNIEFNANGVAKYTVRLLDLSGRELRVQAGESMEGLNKTSFNVSDLSSGIYLIVMDHDNNRKTLRLTVE